MFEMVNPSELTKPRGYSHGVCAAGRLLFVAGQIGLKADGSGGGAMGPRFADQFDQALANVLAVVRAAGGDPASVAKLTIFVTDTSLYRSALKEIGERYRARMGRHYPAMTLVEVRALVEPGALVEIEGVAILRA
jgi:enamine deaminase RidA (YjgF/YER057c/UK114 family)